MGGFTRNSWNFVSGVEERVFARTLCTATITAGVDKAWEWFAEERVSRLHGYKRQYASIQGLE